MKRVQISAKDIATVWYYFFGDQAPSVAKSLAQQVEVAVAISREHRVFLAHGGNHAKTAVDQVGQIGSLFLGTALEFGTIFSDDIEILTFDTEKKCVLYLIPFRVDSLDEKEIDTVVVLYGRDLAYMAFHFGLLSKDGPKKVESLFMKD